MLKTGLDAIMPEPGSLYVYVYSNTNSKSYIASHIEWLHFQ